MCYNTPVIYFLFLFWAFLAAPLCHAEGGEPGLQKAALQARELFAPAKSRFRYVAGSRVCLDGNYKVGYNEISLEEFKRTLQGECGRLRGAPLRGASLAGANLRGADLTGAALVQADLRGADLSGSTLFTANLSGADLTGARLTDIDMNGSTARKAVFARAEIILTNMKGSDLRGADFRQADLRSSDLRFSDVTDCDFRGAQYDVYSLFPFDEGSARRRGMVQAR